MSDLRLYVHRQNIMWWPSPQILHAAGRAASCCCCCRCCGCCRLCRCCDFRRCRRRRRGPSPAAIASNATIASVLLSIVCGWDRKNGTQNYPKLVSPRSLHIEKRDIDFTSVHNNIGREETQPAFQYSPTQSEKHLLNLRLRSQRYVDNNIKPSNFLLWDQRFSQTLRLEEI